ncbi:hypothetical protein [Caldisericum exile]|uniref:hypothetical protein n=1 Tax=Caldisericum exile TaxID=693075 RepID=UPI003C707D6B
MKRNIAFFISTNAENSQSFIKARDHFENLAKFFGFQVFSLKLNKDKIKLYIIYEEEVTIIQNKDTIEFPIGNLGETPLHYDRYLNIFIQKEEVVIKNDYAGSIPVFYSTRNYLSLSNIEPVVVFDSQTSTNDISFENLYGFLRYSHFIWDETAYTHINTMLPDSEYKFNTENLKVDSQYLKTVRATDSNAHLTDKEVAKKLNELNDMLIYRSLSKYEQIILPLSAGYDSRMIFASLSKDEHLKKKLHCFTYGSVGSVEVEAARELTSLYKIAWKFIDLPCQFLKKEYLFAIHNIFGSSLHMHGMYQLEFFREIQKYIKLEETTCLTSGFMTGVPAGQHNGKLGIKSSATSLTEAMNKFSQSQYWKDEELKNLPIFKEKNYLETAEERFRKAFDRFEGEIYQKSVMFDIWTRQRNFISYYPRTLEWCIPVVSPHMNAEYANFFMSLSEKHLNDRYAVELMFLYHYPEISKVISNSNSLRAINNPVDSFLFKISSILRILKINFILPQKYRNNLFDFDTKALRNSGIEGIFPLLENQSTIREIVDCLIGPDEILNLYEMAYRGSTLAYNKLVSLQSLALSLLNMES